jgi:hypothetical protein
MDWTKFERELEAAFATYVRKEKREVHSNDMKITILQDKIKCDELVQVNAALQVAISSNPNYTYEDAMAVYRAASSNLKPKSSRQIKEQNRGQGRGGRGGSGRGFRGRGGPGRGRGRDSGRGRGDSQHIEKTTNGSVFIYLDEGTKIEYHPDITYPTYILNKFNNKERNMLENDRANGTVTPYGGGRGGGRGRGRGGGRGYGGRGYGGRGNGGFNSTKRKIEQLEQAIDDMRSQGVPDQVDAQRSGISQVTTTGGSVMGGRADQSRQYGGRGGGRGWS